MPNQTNKKWKEEFKKLYGDDFKGGFRDKIIDFIRTLLKEQREEIIDDLTTTMSKIYKLDKADMWLYDFVRKYKKEDYNNL
ncbi:MAG: hypothetical protein WC549_04645 [Actinomycetota bacterium]